MNEFKIIKNNNKYIVKDTNNPVYSFDIYPLDITKQKPNEEYTKIVAECLKSELEKEGYTKSRDLLGRCHKNSVNLFKKLIDYGYKPNLVVGANTSAGPYKNIEQSFNNIKNIHQWVEVNGYITEICSEEPQSMGKLYVSKRKPSNYSGYLNLDTKQYRQLNVNYITSKNIDQVLRNI